MKIREGRELGKARGKVRDFVLCDVQNNQVAQLDNTLYKTEERSDTAGTIAMPKNIYRLTTLDHQSPVE